MSRLLNLRPWQQEALTLLAKHQKRDFLAVATPGAGKTTFALVALNRELHCRIGPAVIVAPTAHLKIQWSKAAAQMGIHLDPFWETGSDFASDMHGIVTTYQQVALAADDLYARCWDGVIILDEVHHAGDEMAWGTAVAHAFELARRRISLSGTPFRSDTAAIPFVSYHMEEAEPDYEYGYGEALSDGVVRPVYFPQIDGEMEWISPDGSHYSASFSDPLNKTLTAQRLRTALSAHGQWLPDVLDQANKTLLKIRKTQEDAGGLVICIDTDHAREVAALLTTITGEKPVIAVSDDNKASQYISDFTNGTSPWIVAVRMISEGVDIPRLRVGVYATTITTELFFRQAVGRLVRVTPQTLGARSVMYIPQDPRLRACALTIDEPRRHVLRRKEEEESLGEIEDPLASMLKGEPVQLTLFEAIRSEAIKDNEPIPEWLDTAPFPQADVRDASLELVLAPPPTASGKVTAADLPGVKTRAESKASLRKYNSELVKIIVNRTNETPLIINAQLNNQVGIDRVADADLDTLRLRSQYALQWLDRLTT